jgi:hypothetical protein
MLSSRCNNSSCPEYASHVLFQWPAAAQLQAFPNEATVAVAAVVLQTCSCIAKYWNSCP